MNAWCLPPVSRSLLSTGAHGRYEDNSKEQRTLMRVSADTVDQHEIIAPEGGASNDLLEAAFPCRQQLVLLSSALGDLCPPLK